MSTASYNYAGKLPGKLIDSILLLAEANAYSFLVDKIDKDVFEFTVCTYEGDENSRREYILTCNRKGLWDLKKVIDHILSKGPRERIR